MPIAPRPISARTSKRPSICSCMAMARRLAAGLQRAKHRPPDRMSRLGGAEFQVRIDRQRPSKLHQACGWAIGNAVDESKVLVDLDAVVARQPLEQRPVQAFRRGRIIAFLVLANP